MPIFPGRLRRPVLAALLTIALVAVACGGEDGASLAGASPKASISTQTSVVSPSASARSMTETHRIIIRFRSIEPRLALYWQGFGSGGFPADAARVVTLELGLSSSGSLDSLFIVAYATKTRQLLTATAFGPPSEYIDISGAVVDGVNMEARSVSVLSYLDAIERVGRRAMLAQLPPLLASGVGTYPGYYLLEAWPRAGVEQDIPSDAKALLWTGSSFQPLAAGDPRHQANPEYLRLAIRSIPAVWSMPVPASLPPGQTTTTQGVDTSPVFFVIPVGSRLVGEKSLDDRLAAAGHVTNGS